MKNNYFFSFPVISANSRRVGGPDPSDPPLDPRMFTSLLWNFSIYKVADFILSNVIFYKPSFHISVMCPARLLSEPDTWLAKMHFSSSVLWLRIILVRVIEIKLWRQLLRDRQLKKILLWNCIVVDLIESEIKLPDWTALNQWTRVRVLD